MNSNSIENLDEEANIKTQYEGLIKSLIILASNFERQCEIMGDCVVTDEMALDFDSFYRRDLYQEFRLLNDILISKLDKIDYIFNQQSQHNNSPFWSNKNLATHKDWQAIRLEAREILNLLKIE
jgi:hypothetical protein